MAPRGMLLLTLAIAGCGPAAAPTRLDVGATDVPTQTAAATSVAVASATEVDASRPAEIELPAPSGSRLPGLAAGDDGRLHLSWLEPAKAGGWSVVASSWDGRAWAKPEAVATGKEVVDHWTASPSIAARADGSRALQWLSSAASGAMGTDVRVAVSPAPGAGWRPVPAAHAPARQAENGFAQVLPSPAGFELLWLDAAKMDAAAANAPAGPDVSLRHVSMSPDGVLGSASEVDARVCDCCAVDAAARPDGIVATYRDRSPEELRDIALSRFADGRWSPPHLVHTDGWKVSACPVNGPALDVEGERVVVAWFTAASGAPPRIQVAWSEDGGATFGAALPVDLGQPAGQVDAVLLADGTALVSWLELDDLWVRRLSADGAVATLVAHVPDVSFQGGRPRLARQGGQIWLAWADAPGRGRMHLGRIVTD